MKKLTLVYLSMVHEIQQFDKTETLTISIATVVSHYKNYASLISEAVGTFAISIVIFLYFLVLKV